MSDIRRVALGCLHRRLEGKKASESSIAIHTGSLVALNVLELCEFAVAQAALLQCHRGGLGGDGAVGGRLPTGREASSKSEK